MDMVGKMVLTACVCGMATGLWGMITPDKKFSKQVNFILSLVFIMAVITPFAEIFRNFSDKQVSATIQNYKQSYEDENTYNTYLKHITEDNIEKSVTGILEENGLEVRKISVSIDISESSCISISNIGIECDDFSKAYQIIVNEVAKECDVWEM